MSLKYQNTQKMDFLSTEDAQNVHSDKINQPKTSNQTHLNDSGTIVNVFRQDICIKEISTKFLCKLILKIAVKMK